MDCRVRRAVVEDKPLVRNLLHLYLYDLGEFHNIPLDRNGEFRYDYLDHYWAQSEKGRYAYLFERDDRPAGFALVRQVDGRHSMAEFFVVRHHRRQGLGMKWATQIIRRHGGEWEIDFYQRNEAAGKFWRLVAAKLALGGVTEGPADEVASLRLRFSMGEREVHDGSS